MENKNITKNWPAYVTLIIIDLLVCAYFFTNDMVYSALLGVMYIIVMPAGKVYERIFKNKFLMCWLVVNTILMIIYGVNIFKEIL